MHTHIHIPVKSQLKEYVTVIWEVLGRQNTNETILPRGIVEIVFNLADAMNGLLPHTHQAVQAPPCFAQGMNTQVVQVTYSGQHHLFGIRLQPHMVKSLLGILPSELKNTIIDLTLLKPDFKLLWQQIKEAASFEERVKVIENEFPILTQKDCLRTQHLCDLFLSDNITDFQSLDSLSQRIYYSPRHLNRKAHSIFGMSGEELISYKKFLHAVNLIHEENGSLTKVAYHSGFYDQAHFCRIFKIYSGITAKQYKLSKSELPFHLFF